VDGWLILRLVESVRQFNFLLLPVGLCQPPIHHYSPLTAMLHKKSCRVTIGWVVMVGCGVGLSSPSLGNIISSSVTSN
jgi:hypothetical protein